MVFLSFLQYRKKGGEMNKIDFGKVNQALGAIEKKRGLTTFSIEFQRHKNLPEKFLSAQKSWIFFSDVEVFWVWDLKSEMESWGLVPKSASRPSPLPKLLRPILKFWAWTILWFNFTSRSFIFQSELDALVLKCVKNYKSVNHWITGPLQSMSQMNQPPNF